MTSYAQLTLLHADPVAAKIAAQDRVERSANPAWLASAYCTLQRLCAQRIYLTSDDLWDELERAGVPAPHEPRALGAVMRQAARDGLIEQTGTWRASTRAACHARPIMQWRVMK